MENFSSRLKKLIDNKGITPYYLADKLEISNSTFSRLLNDISAKPSIKTLNLIANYFNVNEDWLLTGEGEMLKTKAEKPKTNELQELKDELKKHETRIALLEKFILSK